MSTFTGLPHQAGEFGIQHTFQDGLNSDFAPEATPPTLYTSAGNAHLLRYAGSELLFCFDRNTVRRAQLPDNHFIMGYTGYNGVLYLVLAQVINGVATGHGQIGTFPSPDYQYVDPNDPTSELVATGNFIEEYRPLHVYLGDMLPYARRPGPFLSKLFDFYLDRPLEVLVQPSYDGSVNLLVHDRGYSAALLINSGFKKTGNDLYTIITRTGQVSTNRYTGADFLGRLQQQLRPQSAAKLALYDVSDGGRLQGGEYRYYLTYCDADGNQTAVACELGPVYVFNASSAGQAEGQLPGVASSKRVQLRATNLDPQLGYVRLAYVRRSGEPTATAGAAARSSERFAVPASGELDLLHTGFETEVSVPIEDLLPLSGRIYRFTTATASRTDQATRLLAGGIQTGAGTDEVRDALRAYARTCRLGHGIIQLKEKGLKRSPIGNASIPELYDSIGTRTVELDGYVGGYANPLNLVNYLGHHDAEAYSWCIQGQMLDGTETEAYPVCGLDNLTGVRQYENDSMPGYYDEQGWNLARTQNVAGVYRFPRRGLGGVPALVGTDGVLNILRGELQMPAWPKILQQGVRSIRIVRAPRRPNRQFQGYLIPTLRAMAVNPEGGGEEYDHFISTMDDILKGDTVSNLKVLPAPQLTLEASVFDPDKDGQDRVAGVFPFHFWALNRKDNTTRKLYDPLRFALYAPDVFLSPGQWRQQLGGSNWNILPVALATSYNEAKYDNVGDAASKGGSWTAYKTAAHTLLPDQQAQSAKLYVVNDNQDSVNAGRFGSHEQQLRGKHTSSEHFYVVRSAWEEYIGVEFSKELVAASRLNLSDSGAQTGFEVASIYRAAVGDPAKPLALVADVYGPEGVWDGITLRQAYPVETTSYFPITDWLTEGELTQRFTLGRILPLYGGDAVVGLSFRRVARALPNEQLPEGEPPQPLSQVLGIVTSNSVNSWARSTDGATISFPPQLGAEQGLFNTVRVFPNNTLKESMRYNGGYSPSIMGTAPAVFVARDNSALLPYARTSFLQRVWASATANESALINGWRYFGPLLFKDYDIGGGALVRLMAGPGGEVLLIYEFALAVIQLNERGLAGEQAGKPIYTQSQQLLPDRAQVIATDLGCQHAFGVDQSDLAVYGFDALRRAIWSYEWGSRKALRISDQRVSVALEPSAVALQNKPVELLKTDARITFDPYRGDVLVNIYHNRY